jgi:hypothetical protein
MANVNRLKNRAQCVKAKAKLEVRLDVLQNRDRSNEFAERQSGRLEATVTQRLTKALADLASTTADLARTDLSPADRRRLEREQMTARHTSEALEGDEADDDVADAFVDEVGAEQVEVQVPVLTTAIAAVQTHHDALTA